MTITASITAIEGPTDDPAINTLRVRQIKNMLATLLVSRGVPMILGGDEFRRTQQGNNNAYCQDNDISWYDWTFLERYWDLFCFVQGMIAFRARHTVLSREQFYTDKDVEWFAPSGERPDWHAPQRTLGWRIHAPKDGEHDLCLLFNAESQRVVFRTPPAPTGARWRLAVDTAAVPPGDMPEPGMGVLIEKSQTVVVPDHSFMIFVAEEDY